MSPREALPPGAHWGELLLNRLDRAPCQLDTLLQSTEQTDLIAQRTADDPHPHARREPAQLRQLDKTATFPGPDLADHSIGNARWQQTIHDEANHTRRPPRIPPAADHPHKQIAGEQRRGDYDFAAAMTTATLLAQQ